MFGYIKVDQANLLGKEFEAYNGIYCTLCRQLGKDYSIFARLILSYDCTFYVMMALEADVPIIPVYTNGVYGKSKKEKKTTAKLMIGKPIYLSDLIDREKSEKENIEFINDYVKNRIRELAFSQ